MKKIIGVLILTGISLSISSRIFAQNFMNVFNARYYIQPYAELRDTNNSITLSEYRIETAVPVTLKNGTILGIKPQWKSVAMESENSASQDLKIYTAKIPFFAFIKWGESKWSSYMDVSPKFNTDLKNITIRHFQLGGMIVNYYEKRKDFYWQFGLYYNQDTYGPFFMVLAGLDWKIDESNYVAALLPAYAIYERRLSKKLYAGFEIELTGETFRMGGSNYENSFFSQLGENKFTFLTEPHLFIDFYFAPHWVIWVKPGLRLFQKYEHFTVSDQRIEESEYVQGVLKNNFYVEVGLAMRFRYDEDQ